MNEDRNYGNDTGRDPLTGQFTSGNPGRPRGARNEATRAAEALLDGEAEQLTRQAVEMALAGDTTALRLCLERILPPVKERPVGVDLPALDGAGDLPAIIGRLLEATASGEITPGEGERLARLLGGYVKAVELSEFDERLRKLEART